MCQHKWEPYEKYEQSRPITGVVVGHIIVLKCVHCGRLKKFKI